jgi:hypothetical protein
LREPVERRHPLRVVRHYLPKRSDVQQRHVRVPARDVTVRRSLPRCDEQPLRLWDERGQLQEPALRPERDLLERDVLLHVRTQLVQLQRKRC